MKDLSNENIIHVKNSEIQYLQFKKLLEYGDIIQHCFTLKPLNFGNNDTYSQLGEEIEENYKKICSCLNLDYKNIVRPYQTHSHNIINVNKTGIFLDEYRNIDGLMTSKLNKVLSLTYADCIPLYFFDSNKKIIANIHSGWQGTLQKIGKLAVEKMVTEYKSDCKDIICVIGPCIRGCHFEVDSQVKELFVDTFSEIDFKGDMSDFILKDDMIQGKQKYYIDTAKINERLLIEAGIREENIVDSRYMYSV